MQWDIVPIQFKTMVGQAGSAGTVQLAFDQPPRPGSLLVVMVTWSHTSDEGATSVVTDGDTLAESDGTWSAAIDQVMALWAVENCVGGSASQTVTATLPGSRTYRKLTLMEFAQVALASALDQHCAAATSGNPPDPGTITPTYDRELIVTCGNTDTSAPTLASGFTLVESDTSWYMTVGYQIQFWKQEITTFYTAPTASAVSVAASYKRGPDVRDERPTWKGPNATRASRFFRR